MSAAESPAHEPSVLGRSMRRVGALLLTLSGITPAASMFVYGQTVISQAGTGAVLAFIAAGLLSLSTAYVYAELASAFPLTGGEYSIIGRTIGPVWGMMALGLNLFGGALGQAALALGLAEYLGEVVPAVQAAPTAIVATLATTAVMVLNVRVNAVVTGIFLAVELAALGVMSALGFWHPHQAIGDILLHPVTLDGAKLVPTSWSDLGLAAAAAIFVFNGYGGAVFFGEEMYEARSKLPWVVFWSLAIAAVAELGPVVAVMVGVADPAAMLDPSKQPLPTFLLAAGGEIVMKAVSLGVAFAILNALIAIGLINARQLYCSGRDGVWPTPVNRWVDKVHPRFRSPWVATLVMGAATAACCFMSIDLLVMLTSTGIVVVYAGVSIAAMVGRRNRTTAAGHYRMPLYPLAPVFSLVGLAGVVAANLADPTDGQPSLIANIAVMAVCALYYLVYLKRRGGWQLRGADGLPLDALEAEGLGK